MTLRAGHGLIIASAGLLALGVVMVASAGLLVGRGEPTGLADVLLTRHALFAALAMTMLLVGSRIRPGWLADGRGLASPIPWIVLGAVGLLVAVHVPGVGHEVNGARRWISLGPVGFQPSEVAKWSLLFLVAWHGARQASSMNRLGRDFLAPVVVVGVACALIATEDLGTAVLVAMVTISVLLAAGAKLRHAGLLVPIGAAGFAAAVMLSPYRLDRLRAFLDPYQDPQGIGYHVLQSMAAVAGGGLPGRGLGNGVQKFGYLPEDTTDFIFAVIAEEMGLAGTMLVVGLYAVILTCGLSIVIRAPRSFERLLGLGILLTLGFQALINMLVVTGLAPTKGIALPLVSAGGTGWCLTAFCLGLLIAMDREVLLSARPGGEMRMPVGRTAAGVENAYRG